MAVAEWGGGMNAVYTQMIEAPFGPLHCAVNEAGEVVSIHFVASRAPRATADEVVNPRKLEPLARQLREFFDGSRTEFDLPLAPKGTEFQKMVWTELRRIPYGSTKSYKEIALLIGRPEAMRAVGSANGSNPIPIVVPCHRVIGADGSLTGFGGGLPVKRWLLEHEAGFARLKF